MNCLFSISSVSYSLKNIIGRKSLSCSDSSFISFIKFVFKFIC